MVVDYKIKNIFAEYHFYRTYRKAYENTKEWNIFKKLWIKSEIEDKKFVEKKSRANTTSKDEFLMYDLEKLTIGGEWKNWEKNDKYWKYIDKEKDMFPIGKLKGYYKVDFEKLFGKEEAKHLKELAKKVGSEIFDEPAVYQCDFEDM